MSEKQSKDKWYFQTYVLVIAILCFGSLALPLLWFNPRFSWKMKVIISALVITLTYYLAIGFIKYLKFLRDYYELLQEVY